VCPSRLPVLSCCCPLLLLLLLLGKTNEPTKLTDLSRRERGANNRKRREAKSRKRKGKGESCARVADLLLCLEVPL
jgi:hypothetical protein